MWAEVLPLLSRQCALRPVQVLGSTPQWRRWKKPDAWLYDGHLGPLQVAQPQIAHLLEAPWSEPETMATLSEEFVEQFVEPTRLAARVASAIVCPSQSAKEQIVLDCGVEPERIVVAHLGVDHEVFRPGRPGGTDVLARYGGRPEVPYVLSVASVHPRKNLGVLREALTALADEGWPHQLVIVGGPAHGRSDGTRLMAETFAELPGHPGRIISVPFGISDNDIASLMSGADAFCLPSLSEGFGLPALEAMACGTPTVLSSRGALTEFGVGAAVMVEPAAASVKAGIRSLLESSTTSQAVGKACAARALDFSWERCAAHWFEAIELGLQRVPAST
jgi:alpha-1,3-rhamnosyl/mannosyltransferase